MTAIEEQAEKLVGWRLGSDHGLLRIYPRRYTPRVPSDEEEEAWRVICNLLRECESLMSEQSYLSLLRKDMLRDSHCRSHLQM